MNDNVFYKLGQHAALEKLGQGLSAAWKALGGAGQGTAKRVALGAGAGGLGGGLIGGDMESALLGAGVGAGGMAGAGHLMGRSAQQGLRGDLRAALKRMKPSDRVVNRDAIRQNYQQISDQVQSQLLPRYSRQIPTPVRGEQLNFPGMAG